MNPYDDDDDETLYRKLTAAKIARKRAEEDLKLLTNRIKLLKSEENKAHKKINETRKRATDIFGQRERNQQAAQDKEMRNAIKQQEKNAAIDRHRNMKEQTRENIIR